MKKLVSLALILLMIVAMFCGCTQEYKVTVNKDGSCKIKMITAIPVESIEEMKALGEMEGSQEGELDYSEVEKLEIKKINGKDCYVEEISEKFSSTKKANKFMLEGSEDTGSYFEKFALSTDGLSATIMEGMEERAMIYGEDFSVKLQVTFPYIITKTNGKLSTNKKTATFDVIKGGKIYAYTTKSSKGAKIYFKENYLKSNTSAYLSWNKVSGAKKYKIEYKADNAKKWSAVTTTKTSKTVKGLKAGKKYSFKVTALTKSKKYTSQKVTISTLKKVGVKAKSKTDKSIKLSWKKDSAADGYVVYMKSSKKADWKKIKTIKKDSTVTYNVKGLKGEKTYYFKVISYKAVNGKKIKSSYKTLSAKTY